MKRIIFMITIITYLLLSSCTSPSVYDKPISNYTRTVEIDPSDADAYRNRGIAYDDKGESDRAIADFNRALEIDPRKAGAYCNRGITYQRKG